MYTWYPTQLLKKMTSPCQGSDLSSLGRLIVKKQGLTDYVTVANPSRGCSMIFEGAAQCPVDRSWCAQRCYESRGGVQRLRSAATLGADAQAGCFGRHRVGGVRFPFRGAAVVCNPQRPPVVARPLRSGPPIRSGSGSQAFPPPSAQRAPREGVLLSEAPPRA